MQRLQLNFDEKLTIKEYLKRKKKQAKKMKKVSKITYLVIGFLMLLSIYVGTQFYVYSKVNNYKYVAGDDVNKQKIYNVYYVTEGYTYDPVYSLSSIHSDGFDDKNIYTNSGLINLQVDSKYIYGMKEDGLYRISKSSKEMETIIEKDVEKYILQDNIVYYITKKESNLSYMDLENKENKKIDISNVSEILVDDNNIFVVHDEKTKKTLLSFKKDGQDKKELVSNANVSYIIQDEKKIYFVNKKDENKIYSVLKDGSNLSKVDDISSVSDKGDIKEIDGSKYMFVEDNNLYYINTEKSNALWKINLETKEKEEVISLSVEILQNLDKTVFYKVKNEMGVYLYNYNTKFMSQVTKRKLKEFVVDNYEQIEQNNKRKDTKGLEKN